MGISSPPSKTASGIAVAVVAILVASAGTALMWWEAVEYRAMSGEGNLMALAPVPTVLSVILVLWLVTVVLDRDRLRMVLVLSAALVVLASLQLVGVYGALERYPGQGR